MIRPELVARMTVCPVCLIKPSEEKTVSRIARSVSRSRPVSTSSRTSTGSLEYKARAKAWSEVKPDPHFCIPKSESLPLAFADHHSAETHERRPWSGLRPEVAGGPSEGSRLE